MRAHVIQHVDFEGPGKIAQWAEARDYEVTTTLALTEEYPSCEDIDFLVIMGGPMDADDEVTSPWLHAEKHFVVECIAAGHPVLGVCLGAQILAEVLGGKVRRNAHKEIGWFPVAKTDFGKLEPLFAEWPDTLVVGQWHGDTFDLPGSLEPLFSSEAAANQAFVFDHRVVGLQFHIEWTAEGLAALIERCGDELSDGSQYVTSASEIQDEAPERLSAPESLLFGLLDGMVAERRSAPAAPTA